MPQIGFNPPFTGTTVPGFGNTQSHVPNTWVTPVNDTIVISDLDTLPTISGTTDFIAVDDTITAYKLTLQSLAQWLNITIPGLTYNSRTTNGNWSSLYQFQYFSTNQTIDISTMSLGVPYSFYANGAGVTLTFTNGTLIGFTAGGSSTTQTILSDNTLTFQAIATNIVSLVAENGLTINSYLAATSPTYVTSTDKVLISRSNAIYNSFLNIGVLTNCLVQLDDSANLPAVPSGNTTLTNPVTAVPDSLQDSLDDVYDAIPLQTAAAWTPVDNSGAGLSLTIIYSKYVRTGRMVTLSANVTYPTNSSSANVTIGGFPGLGSIDSGASFFNLAVPNTLLNLTNAGIAIYNSTSNMNMTNGDLTDATIFINITYFI